MRYCAICEAEAVCKIEDTDCPLCASCKQAFIWGQASHTDTLADISQEEHDAAADDGVCACEEAYSEHKCWSVNNSRQGNLGNYLCSNCLTMQLLGEIHTPCIAK